MAGVIRRKWDERELNQYRRNVCFCFPAQHTSSAGSKMRRLSHLSGLSTHLVLREHLNTLQGLLPRLLPSDHRTPGNAHMGAQQTEVRTSLTSPPSPCRGTEAAPGAQSAVTQTSISPRGSLRTPDGPPQDGSGVFTKEDGGQRETVRANTSGDTGTLT